jgi:hypothetical protein
LKTKDLHADQGTYFAEKGVSRQKLVNAFREHYPAETQGTTWRLINNRDNPAPIYLHDLRLQIKRHIANPQTMEDLHFDWNSIVTLPPEELKAIPVGRPINTRG